ncbi:MAG: CCA tRNA nucleotidyltransferase [Bacillota bacterium]|nr:CCA tRNA nucleotidyltransferase [Bacillota bacterium]
MIEPFHSALPIISSLEKAGFSAFFVGGSVRDYILGRPIHDVDVATSATPDEMKLIFPRTIDIGIEHGTLLILHKEFAYEVTTFRAEKEYVDFRRPKQVTFIRSLKDDLQRRDFTINAIAMDKHGVLIDPFNGQEAIKKREIKTVGKAEERFSEDALRMMRALRFESQLSFSLEKGTLEALSKLGFLLEKIAVERKKTEFEKLLLGANRTLAFKHMLDSNLYQYLPGLKDKKEQLYKFLKYDSIQLNLNEWWSLFIFCLGLKNKEVELFLREWKLPLQQIREIIKISQFLLKRLQQVWNNYDLYMAKEMVISSVEKLCLTIKGKKDLSSITTFLNLYQSLPIKSRSEMAVTGQDLMDWFHKTGGPWLNETILNVERAILEDHVKNEKITIKEWLKECNQI